ncbi:MAG: right-handed parallel beta-helix repeat-containing protein, partial [Candidatus Latescibacteria bacterium]|nr:right-handed parallel beta-helix repeat-containing protein [Candidatus Latescibacterota bacterium]
MIRFARDVRTGGAPVVTGTVLLVLFLMSLFASVSAEFDLPYSGPVWYASPGGDDTNGVGSEAAPWRSIGKAIAEAAPGDTIKVMDDGDAGTNDYIENITVNKRLCIERYDDDATAPRIKGHNASIHVFNVTADSVTIKRLDIYGATANDKAGICLNSVSDCTIRDNRCGWVSSHKNHYGILLSSSNNNTVSGNTCDSNNEDGIFLFSSGDNTISGNTCDSNNDNGIYL